MLVAVACSTPLPGQLLNPIAAWIAPIATLLAFSLIWLSTRGDIPTWLRQVQAHAPIWLRAPILRAVLITPLIIWGIGALASSLHYYFAPATYQNDAVTYLHRDAELVLQGQNPYTNSDVVWSATRRWPASLGTPLVRGRFGSCAICYPAAKTIRTVGVAEAWNPSQRGPEYDPATGHNYPAGSLLMVLPVVWAGAPFIIWLNCVATLVLGLLVVQRAPAPARLGIGLVLLCQTIAFSTNFDAICILFVLLAWHVMGRQRLSPLALGWACAVKQLAWFFVPFYLIETGRRYGWHVALRRGGLLTLAFLLPNLPFIVASPGAWVHSQLVPMTDPMFAVGLGIVAPALAGIWPLWPPIVYTLLEAAAWLGLMVYQARREAITSDGLLLALLPLFFARRSPINYFALLPVLALWLVADLLRRRAAQQPLVAAAPVVVETVAPVEVALGS